MLAKLAPPVFPMVFGVIRSAMFPTYDDLVEEQIKFAKDTSKIKCVDDLLNSGDTWRSVNLLATINVRYFYYQIYKLTILIKRCSTNHK